MSALDFIFQNPKESFWWFLGVIFLLYIMLPSYCYVCRKIFNNRMKKVKIKIGSDSIVVCGSCSRKSEKYFQQIFKHRELHPQFFIRLIRFVGRNFVGLQHYNKIPVPHYEQANLSNGLSDDIKNNKNEKMASWAKNVIRKGGFVETRKISTPLGVEILPKTLTPTLHDFARNLEEINIYLCPDPFLHMESALVDSIICIYKTKKPLTNNNLSVFRKYSIFIRMGIMISYSDTNIDHSEINFIKNWINNLDQISHPQKESLHTYLNWKLKAPINKIGLVAAIKELSSSDIEELSRFLVNVAQADGKVEICEIKELKKIFKSIGLDPEMVSATLHQSVSSQQNITFKDSVSGEQTNGITLDQNRLREIRNDTQGAKIILNRIFNDEDEQEKCEELDEFQESDSNPAAKSRLPSKLQELLMRLSIRETWATEEVQTLCDEKSLMRRGAIENINDWAYEKVDAPIIDEDGDNIFVDLELLIELGIK